MVSSLFNWIAGLVGVAGIGYAALLFLAPGVIGVISEYLKALSPLVRGAADAIVEFFKIMYAGLKDVADNFSTIVFVIIMMTMSYFYGIYSVAYEEYSERTVIEEKIVPPKPQPAIKSNWKKKFYGFGE